MPLHVQDAAGHTRKLYSLHFWGILEQQTRSSTRALAGAAPLFQGCFRTAPVVQPAAAAMAPQQQQPQGNQQYVPQEQQLLVLSAAALIGGWWQPTAEADGGAAQQLALHALQQCFGQGPADAVAAVVR